MSWHRITTWSLCIIQRFRFIVLFFISENTNKQQRNLVSILCMHALKTDKNYLDRKLQDNVLKSISQAARTQTCQLHEKNMVPIVAVVMLLFMGFSSQTQFCFPKLIYRRHFLYYRKTAKSIFLWFCAKNIMKKSKTGKLFMRNKRR